MSYQHNPNTGSLFKNDRRETDKHPQAKGDALIDGVEYWMSAWTNTLDDGSKYQSVKFSRKDENRAANPQTQVAPAEDFSDSIPFN